jgi:hypothetical protein
MYSVIYSKYVVVYKYIFVILQSSITVVQLFLLLLKYIFERLALPAPLTAKGVLLRTTVPQVKVPYST